MLLLNYRMWGEHLATQLWWATARLVVICLDLLHLVRGTWDSVTTSNMSLEKKVNMKCMWVNVLKNIARVTRRLCVFIMSHTHFRVNLHSVVAWMWRNSLLETDAISEVEVAATGFGRSPLSSSRNSQQFSQNGQMVKWLNFAKWLSVRLQTASVYGLESRSSDNGRLWNTNWLDW